MNGEKWFERSFDFTVPVTRFPGVLERLRGTPARLEERIRAQPTGVLIRRDHDRWSIQENVGHLLDLEPLWLRRAEQLFAAETELAPADLTNRRTHEAAHNDRAMSDLLGQFRAARVRLAGLMKGADDEMIARTARHPRLGTPMRLIDLGIFVAEHDDHHLAAIAELAEFWGQA